VTVSIVSYPLVYSRIFIGEYCYAGRLTEEETSVKKSSKEGRDAVVV